MAREFTFKGATIQDLKGMSIEDFTKLCKSHGKRTLKRGFTDAEKKLLIRIKKNPEGFHRTRSREMIIIPELIGVKLGIHNGKEYVTLEIRPEHMGHRLGEFVPTRKLVKHSSPGFGATRSSKYVPLK